MKETGYKNTVAAELDEYLVDQLGISVTESINERQKHHK